MTLPAFDAKLHDVNIGGFGWMVVRDQTGGSSIQRTDATPLTARAALGDSQDDRWTIDSFYAQTDFSGGAGQARLEAKDRYSTGWADSRWQGHVFPPKKKLTSADGANLFWPVAYQGTLYGFTTTSIETIVDVGSTVSRAIGTTGNIISRPKFTASGNMIFIQGTHVYRWDRNSANAPVDITPFAGMTPTVVDRYGHHLWVLGTVTISSSINLLQTVLYQGVTPALTHSVQLATPRTGSLLLAQVNYVDTATTAPTTATAGWTFLRRDQSATGSAWLELWYKRAQGSDRSFSVTENTTAATDLAIIVTEWNGIDMDALIDAQDSNAGAAGGTGMVAPTINTTNANTLIYVGINQAIAGNQTFAAPNNSFTEITEATSASLATSPVAEYRIVSAASSYTTTAVSSSTAAYVATSVAFRKVSQSVDITQMGVFLTTNDGSSWNQAFNADGASGVPAPIASVAAMGRLWFTTLEGLYSLTADEQTLTNQISDVLVAVNGPYDLAIAPFDTTNVGTWVDVYDGIVYWVMGSEVRRYAPNGLGAAIWPTKNWGTRAGKVQALVAGEGGLWWSSVGSLWNYDGTVVHEIAREPTAGDFDYLGWFKGRLYGKGDPAPYLDYGYPGMRPDLYDVTATSYETGYILTSANDFGKVHINKIIASMGLYAEFTVAGSASGSLTLEYCVLDAGLHPERYKPNSAVPTWVTVGTLASSEGVNVKRFTLATPLDATKVMWRVTLTPGASGVPILEGVLADGESIMPRLLRFPMVLSLSTGTRDKSGATSGANLYPTAADVEAAMNQLQVWRNAASAPRYFTVGYLNGVNSVVTYPLCIAEQLSDWLERMDGDGTQSGTFVGYTAQFVARQVPQ